MEGGTLSGVKFHPRLLVRLLEGRRTVTVGLVVAGLVATAVATAVSGGTKTVAPQLGHLFVVVAGVSLGPVAGGIAGVGAGLLLGPLMPLDITTGTSQSLESWLFRLAVYSLVGVGTGVLARGARRADVAFRRTLDQLPTAVIAGTGTDPDDVITYANGAATELLGPIVGVPLIGLFAQAGARTTDGHRVDRTMLRRASSAITGAAVPTQFAITDRQGHRRVVRLRALQTPNGQAVAAIEDLTSQYLLDRARHELVTAAGHHLRTPLTPLLGFTCLVARHAERIDDDVLRGYATIMERNTRRLHALVERLSELATLQAATTRDYHRVSLGELVTRTLDRQDWRDEVRNVVPLELRVEAAPDHVCHALVELVANGFVHGRPPVTVSARRHGAMVELCVRDEGDAVPEDIAHGDLFLPFTGVDAAVDDKPPRGPGLGLALAAAHCHATGATLTYRPPDGFVIALPRWAASRVLPDAVPPRR